MKVSIPLLSQQRRRERKGSLAANTSQKQTTILKKTILKQSTGAFLNENKQMNKTKHAIIRTQQRGISNKTINLLFKEGKIISQRGGTALVFFPKWKKPTIEKNNLKDKNIKNAYMVIKVNKKKLIDSHIITVGHDFKNVHKKTRKKFH